MILELHLEKIIKKLQDLHSHQATKLCFIPLPHKQQIRITLGSVCHDILRHLFGLWHLIFFFFFFIFDTTFTKINEVKLQRDRIRKINTRDVLQQNWGVTCGNLVINYLFLHCDNQLRFNLLKEASLPCIGYILLLLQELQRQLN